MTKLISIVHDHVEEEERDMFLKLRDKLQAASLRRMGEMMALAKKTAPTRAHPKAPTRPPANIVAGMAAGVIARLRDTVKR